MILMFIKLVRRRWLSKVDDSHGCRLAYVEHAAVTGLPSCGGVFHSPTSRKTADLGTAHGLGSLLIAVVIVEAIALVVFDTPQCRRVHLVENDAHNSVQ